MKNIDKTSTEYDIQLENEKLNKLIRTRQDVYDYFTEFEFDVDRRVSTSEIKVQREQSVRKNNCFFIERAMKKPGWTDFIPSGIETTKADTWGLPVLKVDGTLHPIMVFVVTEWLKDLIQRGLQEGWVGDITTYPLPVTKDINKGYVIPIYKLLEELLEMKEIPMTDEEKRQRLKELDKQRGNK